MRRLINPIIRKPTQGATSPLNKRAVRAHNGQGIVEFALVLPLLLLLLFGIMELGRLMIIYTAVHAASREGARYGSAAGLNDSGVPYFLDEEGIRAAAQRIAVLVGADVEPLVWDDGQGNEFEALMGSDVSLGDRVIVSVVARYDPILGLTPLQGFDIRSTTRRTIVKSVAIGPAGHTTGGGTDTAPVVQIVSPTCPLEILEHATLDLTAVASDVEDTDWDALTDAIVWYLDENTYEDCSGGSCSMENLPPGDHTILAEVTDSAGNTGVHDCNVYVNPAPDVIITAPDDGDDFVQGYPINFSATASEFSLGDLNSAIQWTSNRAGDIGTGPSFTRSDLAVGLHHITATVTDGDGQTGSDSIDIVIEPITAPQLFIVAPANFSSFAAGSEITFTGFAVDGAGNNISTNIQWSSNPGGYIDTYAFVTRTFNEGTYVITASLPDPYNISTSIIIYVVENDPPEVVITSPADGAIFRPGDIISFSATANDDLDGNLSNRIVWSSSPTGITHTGASFTFSTLTVGTYTVMAEATDNDDGTGSDSIEIQILNPPVLTIDAPANNANLRWNTTTNLTGTATDYQGASISHLIQWSSSIDGSLGQDDSLPITLSAGTHTITATVTDLYTGFSSSASIVVNVFQTICPTSGNTTWGPSRAYLSWNLIIPAQVPLDSVMSSLSLTWNATGPTVSSVTVNGVTVFSASPAAGSPVNVPGPVWSGNYPTTGYTLPVIFYFATRPGNNQGTFNLQATFEGCSTVLQASTTP